jgi:[FeFe] hydrogenase (group B1/B3)
MRKFENHVQKIKYDCLKYVSHYAFKGTLKTSYKEIPYNVSPGSDPQYRCCVFHERAITSERVKMTMGGSPDIPHMIEVLDSACDQCPVNRYVVTETCRGCIAHRCIGQCPVDAITIKNGRATIDYETCIECGKCQLSCPYNAIADVMRPCKRECPTGAIEIDSRKKAVINYDLCISCGSCVYQCPFGAIQEKSEITAVIDVLRLKEKPIYAMLAPAFAAQFEYVDLGKVITGIKRLGFKDVIEVALGADLVILHEGTELIQNKANGKVLTSSCCPGFVNYIHLKYPSLKGHISHTVSPMIATSRLIKAIDSDALVVFIGPCIAKKTEKLKSDDTDFVLTFEELAAIMDSQELDLEALDPSPLNNASQFGRSFASSGGVGNAIKMHLESRGIVELNIESYEGISECDKALKLLKFNRFKGDFIEGMACKGGCIKGPVTMHHGPKDLKSIEKYSKMALEETPSDSTRLFKELNISMEHAD